MQSKKRGADGEGGVVLRRRGGLVPSELTSASTAAVLRPLLPHRRRVFALHLGIGFPADRDRFEAPFLFVCNRL